MWQLMRMTVVTYSSLLITPVIGLLLCTPKYLMGAMSLGEVVQAAAAFVVVQAAFGWFTDNYAKLSEWASSANRVASLLLALDEIDQPVTAAVAGAAAIRGDGPGGQMSPGLPSRDC
jgi:putative ATP-binding cassette transporter